MNDTHQATLDPSIQLRVCPSRYVFINAFLHWKIRFSGRNEDSFSLDNKDFNAIDLLVLIFLMSFLLAMFYQVKKGTYMHAYLQTYITSRKREKEEETSHRITSERHLPCDRVEHQTGRSFSFVSQDSIKKPS